MPEKSLSIEACISCIFSKVFATTVSLMFFSKEAFFLFLLEERCASPDARLAPKISLGPLGPLGPFTIVLFFIFI